MSAKSQVYPNELISTILGAYKKSLSLEEIYHTTWETIDLENNTIGAVYRVEEIQPGARQDCECHPVDEISGELGDWRSNHRYRPKLRNKTSRYHLMNQNNHRQKIVDVSFLYRTVLPCGDYCNEPTRALDTLTKTDFSES